MVLVQEVGTFKKYNFSSWWTRPLGRVCNCIYYVKRW